MTRIRGFGLIAAMTILSAIALPGSSHAQYTFFPEPITAYGVGSLTVETGFAGVPILSYILTNQPATFTLTYEGLYPDIYDIGSFTMSIDFGDVEPQLPLTAFGGATYQQFENVDVSLIYDGPDTSIANSFMTSDGQIIADMTVTFGGYDPSGYTVYEFATFQGSSIPEPSSLMLAATGFLMIFVFAGIRGLFLVSVTRSRNSRKSLAGR